MFKKQQDVSKFDWNKIMQGGLYQVGEDNYFEILKKKIQNKILCDFNERIKFIFSNDDEFPNMILMLFCKKCGVPANYGNNKNSFFWSRYGDGKCFICDTILNNDKCHFEVVIELK